MELYWNQKSKKTALVTGSAGGVGFAIAESFAKQGFDIVLCDIDEDRVLKAAKFLSDKYGTVAYGIGCDVGNAESLNSLGEFSVEKLNKIDIWVNNAGRNGGKIPLWEQTPEVLKGVVECNLLGILLCTRIAIIIMKDQGTPGHIFNVTGSGVKGEATPGWSAYGATKRGLPQLTASVIKEMKKYDGVDKIGLHTMSPGMVFTDLLLQDSTPNERRFFDLLADDPEEVAEDLVLKMLKVAMTDKKGVNIQYLDPPTIISRLLSFDMFKFVASLLFPFLKFPGKRFDAEGNRIKTPGKFYRENGTLMLFDGEPERKSLR